MIDEGYIKFDCMWTKSPPIEDAAIEELKRWRRALFDAGLIGQCGNVGYGNVSARIGKRGQFIITGTQTGQLVDLTGAHFARVTDYDMENNRLTCHGPVRASSESLTHAAIYALDPEINAIAHVHSDSLWKQLRDRIPTTSSDVAYGTRAMAKEFTRLYRDTDFASSKMAVMGGHAGGLISIGDDVALAAGRFLESAATTRVSGAEQ